MTILEDPTKSYNINSNRIVYLQSATSPITPSFAPLTVILSL